MACHKATAHANWNVFTCGAIELLSFSIYNTLSLRYFFLNACPKQGIMQYIRIENVRSKRNDTSALHAGSTHIGSYFIVKFYLAITLSPIICIQARYKIYALTKDVSNKCNKILCHNL